MRYLTFPAEELPQCEGDMYVFAALAAADEEVTLVTECFVHESDSKPPRQSLTPQLLGAVTAQEL